MAQMDRRLLLHEQLCEILGSRNVYFQPKPNTQMVYPAIVYQNDYGDTKFAGNKPYGHIKRYQVTTINRDPDDPVYDKVAALPMCLFERFFVADDLNHNVFKIYF